MTKPDCYKCKWKKDIIGDVNISCHHPVFKEIYENPMLILLGVFASVGRTPPMQIQDKNIKVVGNLHGIEHGWFNHPLNFDPVWLDECNGFEEKVLEVKK